MVKLSKETYYQRRWLKAVVWFLFSIVLIVYGIIGLNNIKEYDELTLLKEDPISLQVNAKKRGYILLELITKTKKLESVITEAQMNLLWEQFDPAKVAQNPYGAVAGVQAFENLKLRAMYWDIFLCELDINEVKIISFEKRKVSLPIGMLLLGFISLGFQLWVLYTLKTKGIKVYDDAM